MPAGAAPVESCRGVHGVLPARGRGRRACVACVDRLTCGGGSVLGAQRSSPDAEGPHPGRLGEPHGQERIFDAAHLVATLHQRAEEHLPVADHDVQLIDVALGPCRFERIRVPDIPDVDAAQEVSELVMVRVELVRVVRVPDNHQDGIEGLLPHTTAQIRHPNSGVQLPLAEHHLRTNEHHVTALPACRWGQLELLHVGHLEDDFVGRKAVHSSRPASQDARRHGRLRARGAAVVVVGDLTRGRGALDEVPQHDGEFALARVLRDGEGAQEDPAVVAAMLEQQVERRQRDAAFELAIAVPVQPDLCDVRTRHLRLPQPGGPRGGRRIIVESPVARHQLAGASLCDDAVVVVHVVERAVLKRRDGILASARGTGGERERD
jgi:hypothetical protein